MTLIINPMRGESVVAIGDETLRFVLDVEAFLALEQMTGRSFLEVAADILSAAEQKRAPTLESMRALAFAATRTHHPELSPNDCGVLFIRHAAALIEGVTEALGRALPDGDEASGEGRPPKTTKPSPGTGTASSAAGSKQAARSKPSGPRPPA